MKAGLPGELPADRGATDRGATDRGAAGRTGVALPLALFLLISVTLIAHALWVLAELESRLTAAEVGRVTANYSARAEAVRRLDSILSAVPDTLQPPAPALWRIEVPSLATGDDRTAWVSLALVPTPASVMEELGGSVVVGKLPSLLTRDRIVPAASICVLPPMPLWRDWSARRWPPTVAGRLLPVALLQLPALSGSWHVVAPDSLEGGLVGGRAGPLRILGTGLVAAAGSDIVIGEGAALQGVLLSTGAVELAPGAVFSGVIVALGEIRIAPDARVEAAPCMGIEALRRALLLQPRLIGPPAWPKR